MKSPASLILQRNVLWIVGCCLGAFSISIDEEGLGVGRDFLRWMAAANSDEWGLQCLAFVLLRYFLHVASVGNPSGSEPNFGPGPRIWVQFGRAKFDPRRSLISCLRPASNGAGSSTPVSMFTGTKLNALLKLSISRVGGWQRRVAKASAYKRIRDGQCQLIR